MWAAILRVFYGQVGAQEIGGAAGGIYEGERERVWEMERDGVRGRGLTVWWMEREGGEERGQAMEGEGKLGGRLEREERVVERKSGNARKE